MSDAVVETAGVFGTAKDLLNFARAVGYAFRLGPDDRVDVVYVFSTAAAAVPVCEPGAHVSEPMAAAVSRHRERLVRILKVEAAQSRL